MKTRAELWDEFNAACIEIVHALAALDKVKLKLLKLKARRRLKRANDRAGKALKVWEEARDENRT